MYRLLPVLNFKMAQSNTKILILHVSHRFGGAEKSLLELMRYFDEDYFMVLNPKEEIFSESKKIKNDIIEKDLIYLTKSHLKKYPVRTAYNIICNCFYIARLCSEQNIRYVYCNTHRSLIYVILLYFTRINIICCCRDTVTKLESFYIRIICNKIITVSYYIKSLFTKKRPCLLSP